MKTFRKQIFFLLLIFISFSTIAQSRKLYKFRTNFERKQTAKILAKYKKQTKLTLCAMPPMPLVNYENDKLLKCFEIPFKERLKLFPFNTFDTIYLIKPNLIKEINEPRNYFDDKYYSTKTLMTRNQTIAFSNILFNYYEFNYDNMAEILNKDLGCECIERKYPNVILLFVKNKKKDYLAFPYISNSEYDKKLTTFTDDEFNSFDLSNLKVRMILQFFKVYNEDLSDY